jgi:pimeloyl-ACP methyl ester carboxylesterase
MRVFGMKMLQARAQSMLSEYGGNGGRLAKQFLEQLRFEGYERALLSTLRGDLMDDQRTVYDALGTTAVPVQVLWGEDDREISAGDMSLLRKSVPAAAFQAVPGSGHGLLVERGDLVNEALLGFHGRDGGRDRSARARTP